MGSQRINSLRRPTRSAAAICLLGVLCGAWAILDLTNAHPFRWLAQRWAGPPTAPSALPESPVSALPPPPDNAYWTGTQGLNIRVDGAGSSAVTQLTAVGPQQQHQYNFTVPSFAPGTIFRVSADVEVGKTGKTNVLLELRDSVNTTGVPANYAVVYFDPGRTAVAGFSGKQIPAAVEAEEGDWRGIWADQKTADGAAFVMIAVVDEKNSPQFSEGGREIRVRNLHIVAVPSADKR
jgi:hypothetical protein